MWFLLMCFSLWHILNWDAQYLLIYVSAFSNYETVLGSFETIEYGVD